MTPDSPPPRYIFGAGEMADHIIWLLKSIGRPTHQIELFHDSFPGRTSGPGCLPIVANFAEGLKLCIHDRELTMIAAGSKGAAVRYSLLSRLMSAGVPLASAVHPSLSIGPGAYIGSHLVAFPGCIIGKNVEIESWCWLYSGVIIEHDAEVDSNVIFGPGVVIAGNVRIGRHAFLGAGVTVAPGVTIGERSIIGAGAVVVRDIPPGVIAMGVPARVHREVPEGADAPTLEALERLGCPQ